MSAIGEAYQAILPKTQEGVGELLRREGEQFNRELHESLERTQLARPNTPEFTLWMAHALVWALYADANDEDGDFIVTASDFLANGQPADLDEAVSFEGRFGSDVLRDALLAFRNWFTAMRQNLESLTPDAAQLERVQSDSFPVFTQLKEDGRGHGVGLWLFAAPFKIMAVAHQILWADEVLARVLMPAGKQVVNALEILLTDRVIQPFMLGSGEGTFSDEFGELWAMQRPQIELARAARTSVLHINSGLYLLGQSG